MDKDQINLTICPNLTWNIQCNSWVWPSSSQTYFYSGFRTWVILLYHFYPYLVSLSSTTILVFLSLIFWISSTLSTRDWITIFWIQAALGLILNLSRLPPTALCQTLLIRCIASSLTLLWVTHAELHLIFCSRIHSYPVFPWWTCLGSESWSP